MPTSPQDLQRYRATYTYHTCIVFALSIACATAALGSEAPSLPNDGPALAEYLRSTPPPEDLDVSGLIRIRLEDGRRTSQPFHYRIFTGEGEWQQIFETQPAGTRPAQILEILHRANAAPVYTLSERGDSSPNATNRVSLSGDRAMISYAGSDFWLADLGLDFLHWPEQRIDRDTPLTMRKGRSCRVLESINPQPGAAGYTRVRSWVDIKTGGIIIAEAYDGGRRPTKEFEIGGFTKINERWVLKNMEIRNLHTDTRTILEFHYEVEE